MARLGFAAPLLAVIVTACSSTVSSEFDPNAAPTGRPPGSLESGDLGPSVPHDDVQNIGPGSACASSHAGAAQKPIALVFMVDRSGSMGGSDIDAKWNAAVDGLQTFYGESAGSKVRA
ncbi:MAG TPA: VWA domain-containing protein, partial [Labilithrix sp.]